MKSTLSSRTLSSILFILLAVLPSMACGPFFPIIPTPPYFPLSSIPTSMAPYEREENLRLWQSASSLSIPLSDIEQAVYLDSRSDFLSKLSSDSITSSDNSFYTYLASDNGREAKEFLAVAKEMEERWREIRSPWYYPSERVVGGTPGEFQEIIDKCTNYKGDSFSDRYALQIVRALFASRKYDECINFYESAYQDIPNDNLLKRMAKRYAAGCWNRKGLKQRADSIFASLGDIWSISEKEPLKYILLHNPDAPQVMDYIRGNANDSAFMEMIIPTAEFLLKNNKVKYRGDWEFLLAFGNYSQKGNNAAADRLIKNALHHDFSSDNIHHLARTFRMKMDAIKGDSRNLLADLKWAQKMGEESSQPHEWTRMVQNVVYEHWIPLLWKRKDFSKAVLIASYADHLPNRYKYLDDDSTDEEAYNDYSNLSFQMMGSLSSSQLTAVFREINKSTPLNNFLRSRANTNRDYFYELIGTLAIREGKYDRAVKYLSQVSGDYLASLKVSKQGYLARDPFFPYPSRWWYPDDEEDEEEAEYWASEHMAGCHVKKPAPLAKLDFAKQMSAYQKEMTYGDTADKRGLARLMYAIGRFNSFEECWALTQYWRGTVINLFYPNLQYWDCFAKKNYAFLYSYPKSDGHKKMEAIYEKELKKALCSLQSDEAKAEAQYILRNYKTVVKKYGNTLAATRLKSSCDQWNSWL